MLIANASRLTEITCHSPNLINTDLSQCKLLQHIDLSGSTILGTGEGAQATLDIRELKYLRYCNCMDTQLTAIYTMPEGGNLEEIYYPQSTQTVQVQNQTYLHTVGIPFNEEQDRYCENLADVIIQNCKNIKYIQYPFVEGEAPDFKAFRYVQNLNIINSIDGLTVMDFKNFERLRNINLSTLHYLEELKFDDMMPSDIAPTMQSLTITDCPLIEKVSFNVSDDNHKVEFEEGCRIDFSGLDSLKTIESNARIRGLDKLIIPTSLKELKFIRDESGKPNEIKSIISENSPYVNGGFVGMDLKDIELTHLDMSSLSITNAVNFYLAPTIQHPNMNTYRDGVTEPYFCPRGTLDLSNYRGAMKAMFKGLDFNTLDIIMPEGNFLDTDISSLFEGATIPSTLDLNHIIGKFEFGSNLNYIFKNCNISDASMIVFPIYKFTMVEGFAGSTLEKDFELPPNVTDVTGCFQNCYNMKSVVSNWNRTYIQDPIHELCYFGCVNIETIDGIMGELKDIPKDWGGFGFVLTNIGTYTVEILSDNYTVTFGDVVGEGVVDWGDKGFSFGESSHTFKSPGIYTVKGEIYPNINRTSPNPTLAGVLVGVSRLPEESRVFDYMFTDCSLLRLVDLSTTDTSRVESTVGMFKNCVSLVVPPTFDFTSVTNADEMFMGCREALGINFKNLINSNMSCEDIITDCLKLKTLEFTNRVDRHIARTIIDKLNAYLLENTQTIMDDLSNSVNTLSYRVDVLSNGMDTLSNDMNNLSNSLNDVNNNVSNLDEGLKGANENILSLQEEQKIQNEGIETNMLMSTEMYETINNAEEVMMSMIELEEEVTMSSNSSNLSMLDNHMVGIYVELINRNLKSIHSVPKKIRNLVMSKINKG